MKKRDRMAGVGIARVIGASALLVAGGVHLEQYIVAHYSVIPTIGRLFLVNFIAATTLAIPATHGSSSTTPIPPATPSSRSGGCRRATPTAPTPAASASC